MANVMFKRGSAANLSNAIVVDGAFYLTTDTNRLYVGQGSDLVELNKSITAVANIAALPTENVDVGQFYYCENENVLAYYEGKSETNASGWRQINPDTKLDKENTKIEFDNISNGVQTKSTIATSDGFTSTEDTETFHIVGKDAVTVSYSEETDSSNSDNKINTINVTAHDTQYELSSSAPKDATNTVAINLTPDDASSDEATSVQVAGGKNISISQDNNKITIAAADAASMTNTDILEYYTEEGQHVISVEDSDGTVTNIADGVIPTIKYGKGKNTSAIFKGEGADGNGTPRGFSAELELDVYTTSEVDQIVQAADALHYKGTLSKAQAKTLKITDAQLGDVYKASEIINLSQETNLPDGVLKITANIGDLIIAYGTEDSSTGKLLLENATWEVIPSGDDQLIAVEADATNQKMTITDKNGGNDLGSIAFVDKGENIKVTSAMDDSGQNLITTIAHGTVGAGITTVSGSTEDKVQAAQSTEEFEAITEITRDANGHIVSVAKHKLTVTDTHNSLDEVEVNTKTATARLKTNEEEADYKAAVAVVTSVTTMDDGTESDEFILQSKTLNITQQAQDDSNKAAITVDLEWGTF